MKKNEIIELLKSGNFTIAGHDSGTFSIYKGKLSYNKLPEKEIITFEDWNNSDGYITKIISILVESLGGKTVSI